MSTGVPPHISRVLNATIPPWRLISGRAGDDTAEVRTELREALDQLIDAGDLIELAGGRWSPAMTRLVKLDQEAGWLLVGGAPLSCLPVPPEHIAHHGPFRRLLNPSELSSILPIETQANWARIPTTPLQDWGRDLIGSLERVPYSPATQERFEFYCPAIARPRSPQFRRWADEPNLAKGTSLARRTRLFGAKEFRLVDIENGRVVRAGEVSFGEVRRLMYALDAAADNPVEAHCSALREGGVEITLRSEVPRSEQHVLAALGELTIPLDRPYERRWTFHRDHSIAERLLRSLGIEITNSL